MGGYEPVFVSIMITGIILAVAITFFFARKHGQKFSNHIFHLAFIGCFLGVVAGYIISFIVGLEGFTHKSFFIFVPCMLATTYVLNYFYVIRGHPITDAERKLQRDEKRKSDSTETMRTALYAFMALSAAGLLCSTIIHVIALVKDDYVPDRTAMNIMVIGIVIVWASAYIAITRILKMRFEWGWYGDWRVIIRNAPKWMMTLLYILSAYTAVNFIVLIAGLTDGSATYRCYSALGMLIYYAAMSAMYSALRRMEAGKA